MSMREAMKALEAARQMILSEPTSQEGWISKEDAAQHVANALSQLSQAEPVGAPVATVDADGFLVVLSDSYIPTGAPLYLHPAPASLHQPQSEDECRIELVVAVHTLASHYENAIGRLDPEARKAAEGDIAHARKVAARWNWNGSTPPPPAAEPALSGYQPTEGETDRTSEALRLELQAAITLFGHKCHGDSTKMSWLERAESALTAPPYPMVDQPTEGEATSGTRCDCTPLVQCAVCEGTAFPRPHLSAPPMGGEPVAQDDVPKGEWPFPRMDPPEKPAATSRFKVRCRPKTSAALLGNSFCFYFDNEVQANAFVAQYNKGDLYLADAPVPIRPNAHHASALRWLLNITDEVNRELYSKTVRRAAAKLLDDYGSGDPYKTNREWLEELWMLIKDDAALTSQALPDGTKLYTSPMGGAAEVPTQAARDVLAERQRQISKEGWTPEHDDEHNKGELGSAAACYALGAGRHYLWAHLEATWWRWDASWWKPSDDTRRMLVKAGALILAEIERLDRAAAPQEGSGKHG
jgi:hypothetical protein